MNRRPLLIGAAVLVIVLLGGFLAFRDSAEGHDWKSEQGREFEAEAGRRFDQTQERLVQRYPIIRRLPYIGPGFEVNYVGSKSEPDNPIAISVTVETWTATGKDKALQWIQEDGTDPATLDLIYTVTK
ncbi:hypothetical protein OG474_15010 [Kribbella sp. NBC_01505]|uniref:hypothetical protein n=1 Tax=Kribbella sp. NBC_01505 TaxID=2903580 RepID=UPI00386DFCBB